MTPAGSAWLDDTPIPTLAAALSPLVDPPAGAVTALVRPLLADVGWVARLVARLSAAAADDPAFEPPFAAVRSPTQAGLLLHADRHVAILATVGGRDRLAAKRIAGARAGSIVFTGEVTLIRAIRGGNATLSLWRGGWRDGTVAERCHPAGRVRLTDDAIVAIDGRDTAFVVDHAQADLVLLQAVVSAGAAPTLCEYDAGTLALVATAAAREETSRRQMLVTTLVGIEHADAAAFDAASRVAEPYARWHAMRGWTTLDAAAAVPRLTEMAARDPDAEVRGLAERTLRLVACPA